jgi:2'-5' RNA ligase
VSNTTSARLFVALDPPNWVGERLAQWAHVVAQQFRMGSDRAPLRPIRAEMIHLTLCFLGERPPREIVPIKNVLARCHAHIGELSLGAPLWLPVRHPRVLAVEVHEPHMRLASLQGELTSAMFEQIGHQPGRGRFRAHMTVARIPPKACPLKHQPLQITPAMSFAGEGLTLYRSRLSAQGASYEPLLRVPLN